MKKKFLTYLAITKNKKRNTKVRCKFSTRFGVSQMVAYFHKIQRVKSY